MTVSFIVLPRGAVGVHDVDLTRIVDVMKKVKEENNE